MSWLAWPWVEPDSAREPDNVSCAWGAALTAWLGGVAVLRFQWARVSPRNRETETPGQIAHVSGGYQHSYSSGSMWRDLSGTRQGTRTIGVLGTRQQIRRLETDQIDPGGRAGLAQHQVAVTSGY